MRLTKDINIIFLLTFLAFTCVFAQYGFSAEEGKPEWAPDISGAITFETKYVWRGQTLLDDYVMQPEASIGKYGFTFSVWGNYDTGVADKLTEWDYTFDYTFNIGDAREALNMGDDLLHFVDPLSVSSGYILYTFPHLSGEAFESHEFYWGLAYDILLQPFITVYYDFDDGRGAYLEFGGSHTFEFQDGITADVGITTGYNAGQWRYDKSFSNLLFSGEVSIPFLKYFSVSPNVNYSLALDDQYHSEFYGGVKVSVEY
ncbi:MAG: hypothetical protein ABID09_00825 [Candidatus Omnitrophota bacterium]